MRESSSSSDRSVHSRTSHTHCSPAWTKAACASLRSDLLPILIALPPTCSCRCSGVHWPPDPWMARICWPAPATFSSKLASFGIAAIISCTSGKSSCAANFASRNASSGTGGGAYGVACSGISSAAAASVVDPGGAAEDTGEDPRPRPPAARPRPPPLRRRRRHVAPPARSSAPSASCAARRGGRQHRARSCARSHLATSWLPAPEHACRRRFAERK